MSICMLAAYECPSRLHFSRIPHKMIGVLLRRCARRAKNDIAPIAQLVEQLPLKEMVRGSNPRGGTDRKNNIQAFRLVIRIIRRKACMLFFLFYFL